MQRYNDVKKKETDLSKAKKTEQMWKMTLQKRENSIPPQQDERVFRAAAMLLQAIARVALATHSLDTIERRHPTGNFFKRMGKSLPVEPMSEDAKMFQKCVKALQLKVAAETKPLHEAFMKATEAALSFDKSKAKSNARTSRSRNTGAGASAASPRVPKSGGMSKEDDDDRKEQIKAVAMAVNCLNMALDACQDECIRQRYEMFASPFVEEARPVLEKLDKFSAGIDVGTMEVAETLTNSSVQNRTKGGDNI